MRNFTFFMVDPYASLATSIKVMKYSVLSIKQVLIGYAWCSEREENLEASDHSQIIGAIHKVRMQ